MNNSIFDKIFAGHIHEDDIHLPFTADELLASLDLIMARIRQPEFVPSKFLSDDGSNLQAMVMGSAIEIFAFDIEIMDLAEDENIALDQVRYYIFCILTTTNVYFHEE